MLNKGLLGDIILSAGYDVNGIEVLTILLMGAIPAKCPPAKVGDYEADGISDLMVKFDRNN
ncbi:hypothetical protein [Methanosarcina sp. KYL-1]|uniref:hypothetical protein n=1 Tax=Methanosarcina sp. KYL-1 TaxID=2602068 RepID=UPI00210157D0|nr:hypothetical protein [Methanosarcina sp. KYL-1]